MTIFILFCFILPNHQLILCIKQWPSFKGQTCIYKMLYYMIFTEFWLILWNNNQLRLPNLIEKWISNSLNSKITNVKSNLYIYLQIVIYYLCAFLRLQILPLFDLWQLFLTNTPHQCFPNSTIYLFSWSKHHNWNQYI